MSDIRQFQTHPEAEIATESPLAYSRQRSGAPAITASSQVMLRERPFQGHLILRGGAIVLDEALRHVLGLSLPNQPHGLNHDDSGERSVQWLAPDEWLLIVPGGEECSLETRLRDALGDAHVSIVDVSGGQTVIDIEGEMAHAVLMKSTHYDVDPTVFPVGKGVTTGFAKTSAILRRSSASRWELVVRRSFADYLYRWLLDAGEEYGIGVER